MKTYMKSKVKPELKHQPLESKKQSVKTRTESEATKARKA